MSIYQAEDSVQSPSILFRLNGGLYCADSRYVSTIMELPKYTPVPDAPPYISGIFSLRGSSVTLFNLRAALKLQSLHEEFDAFTTMLDARKQDHINWVAALERSVKTGEPFSLATDPHKCKLGRWYDSFKTDSTELASHLSRMEEPHRLLHESAQRMEQCEATGDCEAIANCKQTALDEVRSIYMPKVLSVLEEAKEIFRIREFHEMVLVLSGDTSLGLTVDEVLSVEMVEEEAAGAHNQIMTRSPYIRRVVRAPGQDELILELSLPDILQVGDEVAALRAAASAG
ncbi:chemotaxis protein CheW [Oscillibacter sp. GMB15532]|uniref:chemotaxis protein CheW n=1 Tax=Oscillibacter sp. GMB15532 TaxID=3230022 RepID=UPI0034DEDF9F